MSMLWRRWPTPSRSRVLPHQLAERERAAHVDSHPGSRLTLRSVAPARDDHWLIGAALRRHQDANGLSEVQVAQHLDITVERLRWLQMRTRPNPESPTFPADVERLASSFGCDPEKLLGLLTA